MKNDRAFIKRSPLAFCFLLLLCVAMFFPAKAAGKTAFSYEHDPRLNQRAMRDIRVDPAAVYGFSPSAEGSLLPYADYDWNDPEAVAQYRQNRLEYFASYAQMYDLLDGMTKQGKSTEEIARAVSAKRNELRLAAYDGDPDGLATLKERNLLRYGHEDGPAADELFSQYGSWDTVIEKAFSHNPGMDACVGLYDDYYEYYIVFGYLQDESEAAASREYAVAVFAETARADAADSSLDVFLDADTAGAWYKDSLAKAAANGILKGYEDGTLRPGSTIRRVEALVLLSRCLPQLNETGEAIAFADVPAWAKDDVDRLAKAGLIKERGDGLLGAGDALTVREVRILLDLWKENR